EATRANAIEAAPDAVIGLPDLEGNSELAVDEVNAGSPLDDTVSDNHRRDWVVDEGDGGRVNYRHGGAPLKLLPNSYPPARNNAAAGDYRRPKNIGRSVC